MKFAGHFLTVFVIAALIGIGCSASYKTTLKSELAQRNGKGPIRALTIDSLLYTFKTFSFTDSVLTGVGTLKRNGLVTPFDGSIPFRHIVFIERMEASFWKTVLVVPMLAGIAASTGSLTESARFDITRPTGGSCPYVYAFDGTRFTREAEAFGTSISRSLEAQTFSVLPSLVPVDGKFRVRVSNERPETHFLNSAHLYAADAGKASSVVLDVNNVLWPVLSAARPTAAYDHSGNDILTDISTNDGRYWKSDLAHTAPFSGFRDSLEVEFDPQQDISEATLVIHAVNTGLINEVYRSIGTLLGDETLTFYRAMESDAQLQGDIREWIRECSLRIEVDHGTGWEVEGLMPPEANVVPFSRALRIHNPSGFHGALHVRLSSLADVWRIDAVSIDCSPVQPLHLYALAMMSASSSDSMNWKAAIACSDSSYAVILPPNHIEMTFSASLPPRMRKPVYVFAAQGYLYEWFPAPQARNPRIDVEDVTWRDRIATLKFVIKQRDLFLPPIYAAWRRNEAQ